MSDDREPLDPNLEDPNDPMAAVRPYLALASGILGLSAAKAAELAQGLWVQGSDAVDDGVRAVTETGEQVASLLSPDQVRAIVREEVDRVTRRLGFARADELASLRREVGRLEQQVSDLSAQVTAAQTSMEKAGKKSGKKKSGKKKSGEDSAKETA
jgi:polyhydroxyalkanoate synthesis regulator phasin